MAAFRLVEVRRRGGGVSALLPARLPSNDLRVTKETATGDDGSPDGRPVGTVGKLKRLARNSPEGPL